MQALKYSDVNLWPQRGVVGSRKNVDTSVLIGKRIFPLPIVPANMRCAIDWRLSKLLANNGYFYIMHRFGEEEENPVEDAMMVRSFLNDIEKENIVRSISVGINNPDKGFYVWGKMLEACGELDYVTIDVAHGDHPFVYGMIGEVKRFHPEATVIAGNVATPSGAAYLYGAGADFVKVGVGQGAPCTTKDKTGFTEPMFSCVKMIHDSHPEIPLIADGGVRCNGDIAKAIVAGATLVMAGSLFAACKDSPAPESEAVEIKKGFETKEKVKLYWGSASFENGNRHNIEGQMIPLAMNSMTYLEKMAEIKEDLQSAASYAGVKRVEDMRGRPIFRLAR